MDWLKENWFKIIILIIIIGLSSIFLIKESAENRGKMELTFRQECKKEQEEDFKWYDEHADSPTLVKMSLVNKGYIDNAGNFIDNDIWLRNCINEKIEIWDGNKMR